MENDLEDRRSLDEILEYAQLFWRWAWLLVLAAMIAGLTMYFITDRQPRIYASTTRVLVNAGSNSLYDAYYSIYYSEDLAEAYSETMNTIAIVEKTSDRLGYPVKSGITVTKVDLKPLIEVRVTDTNPQVAADVANTLVSVFAEKVMSDQSEKFTRMRSGIETEMANATNELNIINEKLARLFLKFSEIEAAQKKAEETQIGDSNPISIPTKDPADIAEQSSLELARSQNQNTLYTLYSNLQQIKTAEIQSTNTINQLNPATPNPIPIKPQPIRSAVWAAFIGLMLSASVIFLVTFLQDEIQDPDEITRKWGIPVLGLIMGYNSPQNAIISMSQPRSVVSEAFRSLRTGLQFSGIDNPVHTLLITSATPSEGKTSVVANLATVIAQSDQKTMVVDCDLRRPRIHKIFQVSNRVGLSDYFIKTKEQLEGIIKTTGDKKVCVITSGSLPPNPSELLSSEKMNEMINLLSNEFDIVILDTPPLLAVTDALVLAPRVDGVVLVIDPKKAKRTAVKHAIGQLQRVNANILGAVVNNVNTKSSHYYYSKDYYYDYQSGKGFEKEQRDADLLRRKNKNGDFTTIKSRFSEIFRKQK